MLPQVLVGLGAFSILSASCVLWLRRFQPLFAVLAMAGLAYQGWLVSRRPPHRQTTMMLWTLRSSIGVVALVFVGWAVLWLRYR